MTPGTRLLLAVVAGAALLMLATVGVGAAAVYHAGTIAVEVEEDGNSFQFSLPAGLVRAAIAIAPASALSKATRELEPWLPAVEAGWRELCDAPDFVLVEVDSRDERVRVEKSGSELLVVVDADDAHVRVAVPLGTVSALLAKLG